MKTTFAVIGFVVVALTVGTCVACVDDEDETSMVYLSSDDEDNKQSKNKNGRDCEGSEDCSTFSPSFEDSPIIVCVQPEACRFG